MRLLPKVIAKPRPDDGLGKGMEIAVLLVLFLAAGYGLDRWLGTMPVFTIVLTVVAAIGQFVKIWYGYDARMSQLEAERAQAATSRVRPEGEPSA